MVPQSYSRQVSASRAILSHSSAILAPVFFLDLGAAPLCLQAAVFRAISIFLRLGRPVHLQPHSLRQLAKASVQPMVPGSLRRMLASVALRLDWLEPQPTPQRVFPGACAP